MNRIYVVGSINMDLVITAPFMPENGVTISGERFMTNPGGKGANQAVAVSKLGGECKMVGCVGDAFGKELVDTLVGYGVGCEFVAARKGVSSGVAVIVVVDGNNRIILDAGSNALVDNALIDAALSSAEAGDYLVCQLEIPQAQVAYALKKAKEKGMTTVLNPAPAAKLYEGVAENCDYFIPNQSEAEFYTGVYPDGKEKIAECAAKLSALGIKNVIITLGEQGSVLCGEGKYTEVACVKAEAIDTTAAGDTYVGAFVTRLAAGDDEESAMKYASKAAAVTVTRRGAQQSIPYAKEIVR